MHCLYKNKYYNLIDDAMIYLIMVRTGSLQHRELLSYLRVNEDKRTIATRIQHSILEGRHQQDSQTQYIYIASQQNLAYKRDMAYEEVKNLVLNWWKENQHNSEFHYKKNTLTQ